MKWNLFVLIVAAGAWFMTGIPASAETEILINVFTPPKANPSSKIMMPWIKGLNQAGKGEINIKVPPKSLAPPPRQMDIVTQGIADGAFIFNAFLRKRVPHVQLSLLPMTTTTAEADGVSLWRTYNKYFKAKNPYKDVVLMGFFAAPGGHLYSMSNTPITNAADIKKLKMWSLPGFPSLVWKNLGAAVVPGPAVRIYPIVSKGTVDGFSGLDMADAHAFKASQFAKSVTQLPGALFSASFSVFISKTKWDGLSSKARGIISSSAGEKLARLSKGWDDVIPGAEAKFKNAGSKILQASSALTGAFRKASAPLHAGWIKQISKLGVDGQGALDFYQSEAKKISSM